MMRGVGVSSVFEVICRTGGERESRRCCVMAAGDRVDRATWRKSSLKLVSM